MTKEFVIEAVDNGEKFKGLRALWCEVFDDEPEFVDRLYEHFGDDIKGYVATGKNGDVLSALTKFKCGTFAGRDVYVSYAICTREDVRGYGLAGKLVDMARDEVIGEGGISVISPAEPSLENFYAAHEYVPCFFVSEKFAKEDDSADFLYDEYDEEYKKAEPGAEVAELDAASYNKYREEFLYETAHVKFNDKMMRLVLEESMMPGGVSGLLLINGGDAICAMKPGVDGGLAIEELLLNPKLAAMSSELASEIALIIAKHFGLESIAYRTPAGTESIEALKPGSDQMTVQDNRCQTMAVGLSEAGEAAYYGFPVE